MTRILEEIAITMNSKAWQLWFAPLVRLAAAGIPHTFDERRFARIRLTRTCDRFRLSREDSARALRTAAPVLYSGSEPPEAQLLKY